MNKQRIFILSLLLLIILTNTRAYGETPPALTCVSAILIEETSGKVLYEKDADKKMFPASMTKILTALVALEHLNPDEFVVMGSEVNDVPWDSSKAWHLVGETITVENLIRGLIIPSGNETACVVAKAVAKKVKQVDEMSYDEAQSIFCKLMNEKAKELGAKKTNFVNPHGYHSENHYTTARDMVLIAQAAMGNNLIRRIVAEREFAGNGAGDNPPAGALTKDYDWISRNDLIIEGNEHYYPYATGMKTGFTDEAGYCVTASAEKDGRKLIAVVMYSGEFERWSDARTLFEYGFDNFADEQIQAAGDMMQVEFLADPQLGESDEIELVAEQDVVRYLSKEELGRVKKEIKVIPELIAPLEQQKDAGSKRLLTPIATSQAIAVVQYTLDDEVIYEGNLISTRSAEARSLKSDVSYYWNAFLKTVFSLKAIPFWVAGVLGIVLIIRAVATANYNKHRRKNRYRFTKR